MGSFLAKRLLALIPVAFGVVTLVALLAHVVPGDPVDSILGEYATHEEKQKLRSELKLDRPVVQQIGTYYKNIVRGDFGTSLLNNRPVFEMIVERFPATAELAVLAVLTAIAISLPLGILSAVFAGRILDYAAMTLALVGIATPTFWLGSMLILIFSLELDWLPVSGRDAWSTYILPSFTMGTALAAILSRMTRNSMLDVLKEDYVRTARAKGLSETFVVCKHAFRNAALPLVTVIGLQFGVVLTGAVITEVIFDWPGLGSLLLDAVRGRDYPVIQGCVLMFSATYLFVNLATDIIYAMVDPRIKLSR
jgi:peptide/nickel transport system permease protein